MYRISLAKQDEGLWAWQYAYIKLVHPCFSDKKVAFCTSKWSPTDQWMEGMMYKPARRQWSWPAVVVVSVWVESASSSTGSVVVSVVLWCLRPAQPTAAVQYLPSTYTTINSCLVSDLTTGKLLFSKLVRFFNYYFFIF